MLDIFLPLVAQLLGTNKYFVEIYRISWNKTRTAIGLELEKFLIVSNCEIYYIILNNNYYKLFIDFFSK